MSKLLQVIKVYDDRTNYYNDKGEYHRLDGPAAIDKNGPKCWCKNGRLHREDGPAIEFSNGDKWWYINGVGYTEEQHKELIQKVTIDGKEYYKYEIKEALKQYINN